MLHNTGVHRQRCNEAALAICERRKCPQLHGVDLGNDNVFIWFCVFFCCSLSCVTTSTFLNIILKAYGKWEWIGFFVFVKSLAGGIFWGSDFLSSHTGQNPFHSFPNNNQRPCSFRECLCSSKSGFQPQSCADPSPWMMTTPPVKFWLRPLEIVFLLINVWQLHRKIKWKLKNVEDMGT